jgi:hypothetical protein
MRRREIDAIARDIVSGASVNDNGIGAFHKMGEMSTKTMIIATSILIVLLSSVLVAAYLYVSKKKLEDTLGAKQKEIDEMEVAFDGFKAGTRREMNELRMRLQSSESTQARNAQQMQQMQQMQQHHQMQQMQQMQNPQDVEPGMMHHQSAMPGGDPEEDDGSSMLA